MTETSDFRGPPPRIEGDGFVLRAWTAADARLFKSALDASLEAMQPWIPWTRDEPSPLEVLQERLQGYHDDFYEGRNALYAMMDPSEREVLGGVGLYRRVGPGALEIGYWIRTDQAGQGLATRGAELLTHAGFGLAGTERIEIHCDPRNVASVAIPRRLGYSHAETRGAEDPSSGSEEGSTMVWILTADEYSSGWTERT